MEIWRILAFIAILAALSIVTWYATKFRLEELRNQLYVYPKTGHKYMPLYRCRLKCPVNGEWFDALIYQGLDDEGKLYVRERKDFFDKFVKLNDWKNGNRDK